MPDRVTRQHASDRFQHVTAEFKTIHPYCPGLDVQTLPLCASAFSLCLLLSASHRHHRRLIGILICAGAVMWHTPATLELYATPTPQMLLLAAADTSPAHRVP